MNPTHVGRSPTGQRMHLTMENGFSACGRRCTDLTPIEDIDQQVAEDLCGTCTTRVVEGEINWCFAARPGQGSAVQEAHRAAGALEIAIHALLEIADLDDDEAVSVALEATAKIRVALTSGGGA